MRYGLQLCPKETHNPRLLGRCFPVLERCTDNSFRGTLTRKKNRRLRHTVRSCVLPFHPKPAAQSKGQDLPPPALAKFWLLSPELRPERLPGDAKGPVRVRSARAFFVDDANPAYLQERACNRSREGYSP